MTTLEEIKFLLSKVTMKKIFFFIFVLFCIMVAIALFSSCTVHKSLNKSTEKYEFVFDSTAKIVKKTVEDCDTVAQLPADTTTISENTADTTEQVFDTPTERIEIAPVKSGKRQIKVINKPKVIPVKFHRETVTTSQFSLKKDSTVKVSTSQKQVEKTGLELPWWFWLIIIVIIIILILRLRAKIMEYIKKLPWS